MYFEGLNNYFNSMCNTPTNPLRINKSAFKSLLMFLKNNDKTKICLENISDFKEDSKSYCLITILINALFYFQISF